MEPSGEFARRHIGPSAAEIEEMLGTLRVTSVDELVAQTVSNAYVHFSPHYSRRIEQMN